MARSSPTGKITVTHQKKVKRTVGVAVRTDAPKPDISTAQRVGHVQSEVDISSFPNVLAHFKPMQERASVKKLIAYEKEVNEGFAKTA